MAQLLVLIVSMSKVCWFMCMLANTVVVKGKQSYHSIYDSFYGRVRELRKDREKQVESTASNVDAGIITQAQICSTDAGI